MTGRMSEFNPMTPYLGLLTFDVFRREDVSGTSGEGVVGSWFKATRPDGTDFHTGTVDYGQALTSGVTIRLDAEQSEFPGPGWLHLSATPTECVGMTWPCRLFEVEPVGDVFMDTAHPYKIGCRSVRVLREIDAHRVFGPQGRHVAELIGRCRTITIDEVRQLNAAWGAAGDAALGAARGAALGAAGDAARDAAGGAARDAAWGAARGAAWDAAWYAAWGAAWDAALGAAWYAAWGAALGLVVRDLIGQYPGWWDQAAYDLLTGPWRAAIGPIHPDDPDWTETP